MNTSYKLFRGIISIAYPNRCPFCNIVIPHNEYYCQECVEQLTFVSEQDDIIAACVYNEAVISLLFEAKENGNGYAMSASAKLLYDCLQERDSFSSIDRITYIPPSKASLDKRGYCFPQRLAKEVAALSNKQCFNLLSIANENAAQKALTAKERFINMQDHFTMKAISHQPLGNVLLIDDISTTGATLRSAEQVLLNNGAKMVVKAVFAKACKKHKNVVE